MQNSDWIDVIRLIPTDQHNLLVLTTQTGVDLNIDTILRTEPTYIVFRGRALGQTDDGRVFFLPYQHIDYLQINRQVKEAEIHALYGDGPEQSANGHAAGAQGQDAAFAGDQFGVLPTGGSAQGLPPSPASPSAPAPVVVPTRGSLPGLASRLSSSAHGGQVTSRPSNGPTLPAAASGAADDPLAPPRNSILERLRAQRNSVLPQKPAGR
jgi:hypothetical protein